MREKGDITVIGNVGGCHLLEDIKVNVPCNVEVNIPAEMVIRSRDLQIALQKKLVRRASREAGVPMVKKPQFAVVPSTRAERSSALEEENLKLKKQLQEVQRRLLEVRAQERREQEELDRKKNDGFQQQLNEITAALKRLESRPVSPVVVASETQRAVSQIPSTGISADSPDFIQDMSVNPDDVSIELESHSSDGDENILNAAKRLKSLKNRKVGK